MADISTTQGLGVRRVSADFHPPYITRIYDITPVTDGVTGVATHTIAGIEAGKAVVGFKVLFLTSVTSATANSTLTFALNSLALSGALAEATNLAGRVHHPPLTAINATAALAYGTTTAAITLTMAVGTAALTAGRLLIMLDLVDWAAQTTNG